MAEGDRGESKMFRKIAWGALALVLSAGAGQSAVVFNFEETGSGVFGAFSGSLDLTGAANLGSIGTIGAAIRPNIALLSSNGDFGGLTETILGDRYQLLSPGVSFGSGGSSAATAATGDVFAFAAADGLHQLLLPSGYVSGAPLSGTITFSGATYASLGVTPGSYLLSLPSDTLTVNFNVAQVPLPATLPLLLGGLGVLAFMRRRAD